MSLATPESDSEPSVKPPVTFHQVQEKAMELLKNPIVMAGSALVVGLAAARISGTSKLRTALFGITSDLVKGKALSTIISPLFSSSKNSPAGVSPHIEAETSPASPDVESTASQQVPPISTASPNTGGVDLVSAGKSLLQSLAPHLGDLAKKKLAQLFPNQQ